MSEKTRVTAAPAPKKSARRSGPPRVAAKSGVRAATAPRRQAQGTRLAARRKSRASAAPRPSTHAAAAAAAESERMDLMPLAAAASAPATHTPPPAAESLSCPPFGLHLAQALRPKPAWSRLLSPLTALGSLLRRGAAQVSRRPRRDLRMCEMLPLSEKRFLAVVRYGDVHFLIGGAQNSLTLLSRLESCASSPTPAWNPVPAATPASGGQHAWSC